MNTLLLFGGLIIAFGTLVLAKKTLGKAGVICG